MDMDQNEALSLISREYDNVNLTIKTISKSKKLNDDLPNSTSINDLLRVHK